MTSPKCQVRRATLEDVGPLTQLWTYMRYPVEDLARRITEFQVATDESGKILGAIGFQIAAKQGLVHSETYSDFSLADRLRPALWERINAVATNHGLLRLWSVEDAPFWNHCGMHTAGTAEREKLPPAWQSLKGNWLTLKLRDDPEAAISVDKEFALFMESEKQRSQRAIEHAKVLKFLATGLAVLVFVLVAIGALFVLKNQHLLRR